MDCSAYDEALRTAPVGECFGGGCKRNPIKYNPAEGGEGEREDEVSEEYETGNGPAAELP